MESNGEQKPSPCVCVSTWSYSEQEECSTCVARNNVRLVLLGTTFDLCCIRATKHRMVMQPVKASQAIEEGEHMRRARPLWLVSPYEETVWGWGEGTWLGSVKAEPVM